MIKNALNRENKIPMKYANLTYLISGNVFP